MKLPRDVTGAELIAALKKLGYAVNRQRGSHVRITTMQGGEHHEVIPNHRPIRTGTLGGILKSIAAHHEISIVDLLALLEL